MATQLIISALHYLDFDHTPHESTLFLDHTNADKIVPSKYTEYDKNYFESLETYSGGGGCDGDGGGGSPATTTQRRYLWPSCFVLTFSSFGFRNALAPRMAELDSFAHFEKNDNSNSGYRLLLTDSEFQLLASAPSIVFVRKLDLMMNLFWMNTFATANSNNKEKEGREIENKKKNHVEINKHCPLLQKLTLSITEHTATSIFRDEDGDDAKIEHISLFFEAVRSTLQNLPAQCIEHFNFEIHMKGLTHYDIFLKCIGHGSDEPEDNNDNTEKETAGNEQKDNVNDNTDTNDEYSCFPLISFFRPLIENNSRSLKSLKFGRLMLPQATSFVASPHSFLALFTKLICTTCSKIESIQFADKIGVKTKDKLLYQNMFSQRQVSSLRDLTMSFLPSYYSSGSPITNEELCDEIITLKNNKNNNNNNSSSRRIQNITLLMPPRCFVDVKVMATLLSSCSYNLTSLTISSKTGYAPSTTVADIFISTLLSSENQVVFSLRKLSLCFNSAGDTDFPPSLFQVEFPEKTSLDFLHISLDAFNDLHLAQVGNSFPHLRRLELENIAASLQLCIVANVGSSCCEVLASNCPNLEVLDILDSSESITIGDAAASLSCGFFSLRQLHLDHATFHDDVAEAVSTTTALEVISLHQFDARNATPQLTDEGAKSLAKLAKTLRVLDLGKTAFTDEGMKKHISKLTKLEALVLTHSQSITAKGFHSLVEGKKEQNETNNSNIEDSFSYIEGLEILNANCPGLILGFEDDPLLIVDGRNTLRFVEILLLPFVKNDCHRSLKIVDFPIFAECRFSGKELHQIIKKCEKEIEE